MLVLSPDNEPTLLVPILDRPDAEAAEGAGSVSLVDSEDGTDPYEVAGPVLHPDGEFGISDSAWAMHLEPGDAVVLDFGGLRSRRVSTRYFPVSVVRRSTERPGVSTGTRAMASSLSIAPATELE